MITSLDEQDLSKPWAYLLAAMRRPTLDSNHSSTPNRNSSSSRPTIETNLPKPEQSSLTSTLKSKFSRKSSLLGNVGLGGGSSTYNGNGGRGRAGSDATVRTNATGANAGRGGLAPGMNGYEMNDRNSYETGRGGAPIVSVSLSSFSASSSALFFY